MDGYGTAKPRLQIKGSRKKLRHVGPPVLTASRLSGRLVPLDEQSVARQNVKLVLRRSSQVSIRRTRRDFPLRFTFAPPAGTIAPSPPPSGIRSRCTRGRKYP